VANKGLFLLGPIMTIMPALAAWAVIPFGPTSRWPTSTPACCS
jgi:NADH:ubiquinone oxidoreductase subunit H